MIMGACGVDEKEDGLSEQTRRLIKREVLRILEAEDGGYLSTAAFKSFESRVEVRLGNVDDKLAVMDKKLDPVLVAQEKVLLAIGKSEEEKRVAAAEKSVKEEDRAEAKAKREWWSWALGMAVMVTVLLGVVVSVLTYLNAHPPARP